MAQKHVPSGGPVLPQTPAARTYTGAGAPISVSAGFRPMCVQVYKLLGPPNGRAFFKTDAMPSAQCYEVRGSPFGGSGTVNAIEITSNGFTVSGDAVAAGDYAWVAW